MDFGCGTGAIARALGQIGWNVTGVDASPNMIARARDIDPRIDWRAVDSAPPLPFADRQFEVVIASSVLEYLSDPQALLGEFARILAEGGLFVATVPDPRHPIRQQEMLRRRIACIDPIWWALRGSRWGPYLNYLRLSINRFPLEEWRTLLRRAGFEPEQVAPCADPLVLLVCRRSAYFRQAPRRDERQ